jgi:hypothetical protein
MSEEELPGVEVLARVGSGQLRVIDASQLLGVSYRQAKRLWKRYCEQGAAGMKHGSAGRASNRGHTEEFRRRVLGLVRRKYGAVGERFGPTLAAEHLASEDRLAVHAETLRRWMLSEGLWSRERRRCQHRLSGGAQRMVRTAGGAEGRLSSSPSARGRVGSHLAAGERVVSQDGVVRYANRYFQLDRWKGAAGQSKVLVRALAKRKWVPPENHRWREAAGRAARQKAMREAAARPPLACLSASF